MSIDFSLEQVQTTEVFTANATHNLSPMWHEAGCYDAIYMSEGIKAKHALPFIEKGYEEMKKRPKDFQKLNPPNNWGSYEFAITYLDSLIGACTQFPESIIRISK